MLLTDDAELKKGVSKWTVGIQAEIAKRGIYCLTPFPANTLMWSHYADNHRGICIEFGKDNDLISKARPIHYFAEYPALTAKGLRARPLQVVLNKSNEWGYELEWRLIGSRTVPGPTYMDCQFVRLPDGAITAVIVGCENPFFDEVAAIVAEHAPSVVVRRAVRDPKSYKLDIVTPTAEQQTDLQADERSQYAVAGDSQRP